MTKNQFYNYALANGYYARYSGKQRIFYLRQITIEEKIDSLPLVDNIAFEYDER